MRMKALDSFHASDVGMMHAGVEFEVGEARGAELAKRGHAVAVADEVPAEEIAKTPRTKKAPG